MIFITKTNALRSGIKFKLNNDLKVCGVQVGFLKTSRHYETSSRQFSVFNQKKVIVCVHTLLQGQGHLRHLLQVIVNKCLSFKCYEMFDCANFNSFCLRFLDGYNLYATKKIDKYLLLVT